MRSCLSGADQRQVLTHLDELFVAERNSSSLFTSLCDVLIDPTRSTASVLSAGHEAPLLIGPDGAVQPTIDAGPVIGLGLGVGSPTLVDLPTEWAMLLFTDGIFEGRCSRGGRLGVEAFAALAAAHLTDGPAPQGLSNLLDAVEAEHGGPLPDDVALFLLTGTGSS